MSSTALNNPALPNKSIDNQVINLNSAADNTCDARFKIALLQTTLDRERGELFLEHEALEGVNLILDQLFDDLLQIESTIHDSANHLKQYSN